MNECWETILWLFLTSVMVYLTCRQGHRTESLISPPKGNWRFSAAGLNGSQDYENDTMAKDVALWLMWHHSHLWPLYTGEPNPRGVITYTNVWHLV